jgi:hypothetical protein
MNATLNIAWQTRRSELIDQIYSPACDCHSIVKGDIQAHLESGVVPQGVSIIVHSVELLERPSPDEAKLRVVREVKPYVLRDENGQKLEERPGRPATSYLVVLRREGDRWLVHVFTEEGPA